MKPTLHILSTILLFLICSFFIDLNLMILLYALILTILIDLIEHGTIIFKQTENAIKVRKLLFQKKIREAHQFYYNQKQEYSSFTFFHNFLFLIVFTILILTIHKSYALLFGISFHLICDFVTDLIVRKKLHPSWFLIIKKKD